MKKKIIIMFALFFIGVSNCLALSYGGCEYSEISRLKSLVNNINISYDYHETNLGIYFDVTINNITKDMYFYDTMTDKYYYYADTNNGELTIYNYSGYSGTYKFYSNIDRCMGISLGAKYYSFPSYNYYYNDPACSDVPNFSLCQKWVNNRYSYSEFLTLVNEYKSNLEIDYPEEPEVEYSESIIDKLIQIYINYYYYFFIGIILICSVIIFINRRKNRFKL